MENDLEPDVDRLICVITLETFVGCRIWDYRGFGTQDPMSDASPSGKRLYMNSFISDLLGLLSTRVCS